MRPLDLRCASPAAHDRPHKAGLAQGHFDDMARGLKESSIRRKGLTHERLGVVEIVQVVARSERIGFEEQARGPCQVAGRRAVDRYQARDLRLELG